MTVLERQVNAEDGASSEREDLQPHRNAPDPLENAMLPRLDAPGPHGNALLRHLEVP
jgi:hypothetical protein